MLPGAVQRERCDLCADLQVRGRSRGRSAPRGGPPPEAELWLGGKAWLRSRVSDPTGALQEPDSLPPLPAGPAPGRAPRGAGRGQRPRAARGPAAALHGMPAQPLRRDAHGAPHPPGTPGPQPQGARLQQPPSHPGCNPARGPLSTLWPQESLQQGYVLGEGSSRDQGRHTWSSVFLSKDYLLSTGQAPELDHGQDRGP